MGEESHQLGTTLLMELPASVKEAIEGELSKCKLKDLESAFVSLKVDF